MRSRQLLLLSWLLLAAPAFALEDSITARVADAFDFPLGNREARGYHKARGFQPNGHLGEDWNGNGGGDTDLGDPITCIGNGVVILARDVHLGWGNVVLVRHAFYEAGQLKYIDSLYGHLDSIAVTEGDAVSRGQQIGTLGTNHGMYDAHLHFEIHKNLALGMNRAAFARDFTNYYDPTAFLLTHRSVPAAQAGTMVAMITATSSYLTGRAATADDHAQMEIAEPRVDTHPPPVGEGPRVTTNTSGKARGAFKVDRFGDLSSRL